MAARSGFSLAHTVRTLPAPSFSFVMASGIVSISLLRHDLPAASWALLVAAIGGYLVLIGLTVAQLVQHPEVVREHLRAPHTRFGYFTFVAGSEVLGSRLILADVSVVPLVQLGVALCAWPVIATVVLRAVRTDPTPWRSQVDGSWFLMSVGSNAIGVLAANLAGVHPEYGSELALLSLLAWTVGIACYGLILFGVLTRVVRRQLTAQSLTAPYWITMGACAITVLNSMRIAHIPLTGLLGRITEVVAVVGLVIWVFATALIPLILIAGWWRHARHRVALDNTVMLWSIVFPLGMYDVASTLIAQTFDLSVARMIGTAGVWLALAAWLATVLIHLVRRIMDLPRDSSHRR